MSVEVEPDLVDQISTTVPIGKMSIVASSTFVRGCVPVVGFSGFLYIHVLVATKVSPTAALLDVSHILIM